MDSNRRFKPTALITGASGGIGLELAEVFAEEGFDLIVVARREPELAMLARRLEKQWGTRVTVLPTDLLGENAAQHLFDQVQAENIEVDVLVNNAGLLDMGSFREIGLDAHMRLIQLNIATLTALSHLWLGPMVARGSGRILNVASIAGFQPIPSLACYAAAKAFVLSLTESLSEELQGTGVTITALCPGFTKTDMVERAQESNRGPKLPDFLVADVSPVAREGYEACMAGRVIAVPGIANRLHSRMVGAYPRWLVRSVGGLIGRNTF